VLSSTSAVVAKDPNRAFQGSNHRISNQVSKRSFCINEVYIRTKELASVIELIGSVFVSIVVVVVVVVVQHLLGRFSAVSIATLFSIEHVFRFRCG